MTPRRGLGVAAVIAVLLVLSGVQAAVQGIAEEFGNDTFAGYAGLFSPFTLVDGVHGLAARRRASAAGRRRRARSAALVFAAVAVAARRRLLRRACSSATGRWPSHEHRCDLEQVSRWFGNVVAVNDVTMTIGPGVTGLLGPNGAGKSTLIHMMAGFLAPSAGTVTLDGEPVWRNEEIYRRHRAGARAGGDVRRRHRLGSSCSPTRELHRLADPEAAARAGDRRRSRWPTRRTATSARTPRA